MRWHCLALTVLCSYMLGCGAQPMAQLDSKPTLPARSAEVPPPLSVATWKETEAIIAKHKGKVVVVDLWSSWCDPCLKEFPGLVKLHHQDGDKIACLSVNLNYSGAKDESPEDSRAEVLKFLTEQGADFQNILCADPDTDVYEMLKLASVPAVLIFDKTGQMRKRFDNESDEYGKEGFKYDPHITLFVETLVNE
jgi:thiol-disulfide isomerase/thioredoxin